MKPISRGAFGKVYLGRKAGRLYAVKVRPWGRGRCSPLSSSPLAAVEERRPRGGCSRVQRWRDKAVQSGEVNTGV